MFKIGQQVKFEDNIVIIEDIRYQRLDKPYLIKRPDANPYDNYARMWVNESELTPIPKYKIGDLVVADIIDGNNVARLIRGIIEDIDISRSPIMYRIGDPPEILSMISHDYFVEEDKITLSSVFTEKMKKIVYNIETDLTYPEDELSETNKHTFEIDEPVLVRNTDDDLWELNHFAYMKNDYFICMKNELYLQCIKLKGNEKLLGTSNSI